MRRFELHRHEDETGVSGTGVVAEGVVFAGGKAVVAWRGPHSSVTVHDSLRSVEAVHLHGGLTEIVWVDLPQPVLDHDGRPVEKGMQVRTVPPGDLDPAEGLFVLRTYHWDDGTPVVATLGVPECGGGQADMEARNVRVVELIGGA